MTAVPGDTVPLTLLEAVNTLLRDIGQSHVASLNNIDRNADAEKALGEIVIASKECLETGYHFNIEKSMLLTPDSSGYLNLPANTLRVDTAWQSKNRDLVQRGMRLYNRVNNPASAYGDAGFIFTKPVYVDLVVALSFDDMPSAAKWYITVKAARRFTNNTLVSDVVRRFTQADEDAAQAVMGQQDTENDDRTMKQSSPHVNRMSRR